MPPFFIAYFTMCAIVTVVCIIWIALTPNKKEK